ncbi:hypothetical protein CB1_000955011 [Camelus ferus]|nr:hypothetical protein CB1_000955011 [Camelus ferus]
MLVPGLSCCIPQPSWTSQSLGKSSLLEYWEERVCRFGELLFRRDEVLEILGLSSPAVYLQGTACLAPHNRQNIRQSARRIPRKQISKSPPEREEESVKLQSALPSTEKVTGHSLPCTRRLTPGKGFLEVCASPGCAAADRVPCDSAVPTEKRVAKGNSLTPEDGHFLATETSEHTAVVVLGEETPGDFRQQASRGLAMSSDPHSGT